jgi:hypothetical protein
MNPVFSLENMSDAIGSRSIALMMVLNRINEDHLLERWVAFGDPEANDVFKLVVGDDGFC